MRCRKCDYQLWNLASRTCPECGDPFAPSGYTFRNGAVEFHCPHCRQTYFGTGDRGQLEPTAFACVGCGRDVTNDEMVLTPADGVVPDSAVEDQLPWLRRRQAGFWKSWWRTALMGAINPIKLARSTPPDAAVGPAWRFASFNHLLVFVTGGSLYILFFALMMGFSLAAGGGGGGLSFGMLLAMIAMLIGVFIAFYVIALVFLAVWIAITHLLLRITGGAPHPMRATAVSILYTSGAYLTNLIPCVNNISWLWWPVTAGITLSRIQGVAMWRGITAALVTPVLTIATFIALYVWFMMWALTIQSTAMSAVVRTADTRVALGRVHAALSAEALGVDAPPVHALSLLASDWMDASAVVHPATLTSTHDIPAGDSDLADFLALSQSEQAELAAAAAGDLPDDVIAHRLGDLVLTYHGIDLRSDQKLWTAIISPDPDANPGSEGIDGVITVLSASGQTETIDVGDFPERLAEQNERRAKSGLAPLPHPYDVRHALPAAARSIAPPP